MLRRMAQFFIKNIDGTKFAVFPLGRYEILLLPKVAKKALIQEYFDSYSEPTRIAADNLKKEILINENTRDSVEQLKKLRGKKNLKLNLGCGRRDIKSEWVNVDIGDFAAVTPDNTTYVRHDLRQGLPLEDNSCEFIYSSAFFEHLEYRYGLQLMADCYRALSPGGIFRLALPDFRKIFDAYLRREHSFFELIDILSVFPDIKPGTETIVDYVNFAVYEKDGQHKCILDEEKLVKILQEIGFSSVAMSSFRKDVDVDRPVRRRYLFYTECIK